MARIASLLIVVVVVVGGVLSAPAPQHDVQVLEYVNDNPGTGNYKYGYELSNGQVVAEVGEFKDGGGDTEPHQSATGSYQFFAPDGELYWVTYTADEDGFRPKVGKGLGAPIGALKSLVG